MLLQLQDKPPNAIRLVPARGIRWNSGTEIRFGLGDGPAQLTQGFGGAWETLSRPQRVAMTRWVGTDPIGQDVPILLDGFSENENVSLPFEQLFLYSRKPSGDPPTVWRVGGPIWFPGRRWVIADIELGDVIRDPLKGVIRQHAVLKLLEYVPADRIKIKRLPVRRRSKKAKIRAGGHRSIRQYAVKAYGSRKVARALGKAQRPPVRDLGKKIRKGRVVRLPRRLRL